MIFLKIRLNFQILCIVFAILLAQPYTCIKAQQSVNCSMNYAVGPQGCTTTCTTTCPPNWQCNTPPSVPCPYPCPNQPFAPLPNQPCPNQPVLPTPVVPCPNQPIAPSPSQPCPNQPVVPTPVVPCPNQPIAPSPSQPCPTPQPCPPPTQCPTPTPPTPCPTCPTAPPTTQPHTTPQPMPRPTAAPPPATIIRCPEGTILMNHSCRLIYCYKGVYRNNKCIQTVCPEGTTWTGYKCAPIEPIVHSIAFNHTIVTHFNRTEPDVVVNNVNNMVVNASVVVPLVPAPEPAPTPQLPTTTTTNTNVTCCNVISPRICQRYNSYGATKWNCFSRRYKRCGEFCVAPIVYLKAPRARETASYVVVPPDDDLAYCRQAGRCPESDDFYDCSGCATGQAASCSSYCSTYQCSSQRCQFYDQQNYCTQYPGEYGCQEQDGCLDDWCDGDIEGEY